MASSGPKSGLRLVKSNRALDKLENELDELLVEKTRVTIQRAWQAWRELEAYKLKRGYCILGMTCMRKAVETESGSKRGCPHHLAASKAGIRLFRKESYQTEYGKLQQMLAEQERAERERQAKAEKEMRRAKKVARPKKPAVRRKAA